MHIKYIVLYIGVYKLSAKKSKRCTCIACNENMQKKTISDNHFESD